MINELLGAALLSASIALASPPAATKLTISVSLPPQVWLVDSIGGPRVAVTALVGPGDSEETYSPTDAQVSATLRSDVFFRIGASFEEAPWFRALTAARTIEVVDTRADVDLLPMRDGGATEAPAATAASALDPHVWTSPRRLAQQARTIAATLAARDPEGHAQYERGLRDTLRELEILDSELTQTLAPFRGRAFFVFHPTWGYFADDYGLRQIAIEAFGKEPTDRDLTRLLALARVERPAALFVEPQASGSGAEAVAAAIGARVVRVDSLAPDVPASLRRFARDLVASLQPMRRSP